MTDTLEKLNPLDNLTPSQRERLAKLSTEISHDKLTVSFMIEERNADFGKRSAFYSVTASRDHAGRSTGDVPGWAQNDFKVIRCLLCKHVVAATYDDAVKRKIITGARARVEAHDIIKAYDALILKHLTANGD